MNKLGNTPAPSYESRRIVDGEMLVETNLPITARDGTVLWCNVHRPLSTDQGQKVPPIVAFTCYGKDIDIASEFARYWDLVLKEHPDIMGTSQGKYLVWEAPDPEYWVARGYAVVVVDARGTGKSPGYFEFFSPIENHDYYDAIEWAGVQSWSSGKVGTLGVSYLAIKQWGAAALQPPHLAAMIPWEGAFDYYREQKYHGGIFSNFLTKLINESQLEVNQHGNAGTSYRDRFTGECSTGPALPPVVRKGNIANIYQLALDHPLDDAFNQERRPNGSRITVPLLSAGNWGGLGLHLRGNVTGFCEAASKDKWLEMHTDSHFGSAYLEQSLQVQTRFFDHFLREVDNGFEREPRLLLTIRDPRGDQRRQEHEWPLSGTQWTPLFLAPGKLQTDAPPSSAPIAYEGLSGEVTLGTDAFAEDTEFTGPLSAVLYVSTDASDMDLFLTVRLFDPLGQEVTFRGANDPCAPVTQGWLRVSHRKMDETKSLPYQPHHTHDEVQPLVPGQVEKVHVEIWPTSIVVPAGYRLALTVGAKDFERPDAQGLMKGSGIFLHNDPVDRSAEKFGGVNTIHTGKRYPSHLLLPKVPHRAA
ncbi:MAG: CocE/NonD family hydrolase [Pigmentiphaga sp.]|uniref:CocE/NonD family hydrolase n=1 Tax=Pigmentiphaga sp. TaxID=1977564 RepID=UPI003B57AFA7